MPRWSVGFYVCALIGSMEGTVALAQEEAESDRTLSEVVVTGSRVIRDGYRAPTPMTVLSMDQLQNAAPTSLSDAVNQLPNFKNSFTVASTGFRVGAGGGGAFLNLRGLSSKRNLVLLDGRRLVQSSVVGSVAGGTDLNLLPQALVSRIDVVTGGASAAYGSDAVSGVINFVLDTEFEGFRGEVNGGISQAGDNENGKASLAFGTGFAGGRGRFLAAGEYVTSNGVVDFTDRDWTRNSYAVIATRTPAAGQTSTDDPTRVIAPNVRPSNMATAGLITSGPLAGRYFLPDGTTAPFPFGTLRTATTMSGGGIDEDFGRLFSAVPPQDRYNLFVHTRYELTPQWTVFVEGLYARSETEYRGMLSSTASHQPYTIFADNAYLHPDVRAALGTTTSFTVGRIDTDLGFKQEYSLYDTKRGVVGLDGEIGNGWKVSAYYTHGQATHDTESRDQAILTRLFQAVDAVVAPAGIPGITPGSIVCRSTLTDPTNGCVPINVMGADTISEAGRAWVTGTPWLHQVLKQDVIDVSIIGEPFQSWAGPVSFGAGVTYRREEAVATADPISESYLPAVAGTAAFKPGLTPELTGNPAWFPAALRGQLGGFESSNTGSLMGDYSVKEVFAEILFPLARDKGFARSLDLNAAVRYADYSTSGGVTSWKGGVTWDLLDGLRLRTTRSRDVRAANLAELFQGVSQSNPAITDPFRGNENNTGVITRSFGNPTIDPEQGDTFTAGLVLQPSFIPGFSMSVDYYDIKLEDSIGQLGSQNIVTQCFQGVQHVCSLISRNTDPSTFGQYGVGPIVSVDNQFLNTGTVKTSGVDVEVSQRLPMSAFREGWAGSLSARLLVNYLNKLETKVNNSTSVTRSEGVLGGIIPSGSGGGAKWTGSFGITYDRGPLTLFVQERYIHSGRNQATVDENGNPNPANAYVNPNPTQNGLVPNRIPAMWYTDATAKYRFGAEANYEVFLTVNNLFDRDPPIIPTFFIYGPLQTNYQIYDMIGANYTFGFRARF